MKEYNAGVSAWYAASSSGGLLRRFSRQLCLLLMLSVAIPLWSESKDPANYPLRLHIFTSTGPTFYHNRVPVETRGTGRANLFENSEPRGVDFSFDCSQRIVPSFGFETYPAKWKKRNEELVVLLPVFGKSNAFFTCNLKTQLKEYAYFRHNGRLDSESPVEFKAWMSQHDYDPEHGKNVPISGGTVVPTTPIEQARLYLTGPNKDTEKARNLLLGILQNGEADSAELAWTYIYLGYIEDRAKNRQAAIKWYEKALRVDEAPSGSLKLARYGVQQALRWIRHLDADGVATQSHRLADHD